MQEVARGFTKSGQGVLVGYNVNAQQYGLWVNSELVNTSKDEREIEKLFKAKVRGGQTRFTNWQY